MKQTVIAFTLLLVSLGAFAQTVHKYKYIAASYQPQYTIRLSGDNTNKWGDSLTIREKNRRGYTVFLQFQRQVGKNLLLQTGIQYTNTGFIKTVSNLNYKTKIHPDMEELDQTIQTVPEPKADLHYVFDYIDIPVLFNRQVYLSQTSSKHWSYYTTFGFSLNFLLQDRVNVQLRGFTMDNKRIFNLQNTYLASQFFNMTLHGGFRADYEYSNKMGFFTQPIINIPVLPATRGNLSYRFISGGVNVGVYFNLDIKGEEVITE